MRAQSAKEAAKIAASLALADADGDLVISGGYYTADYLIGKGVQPLFQHQQYLLDLRAYNRTMAACNTESARS